METQMISKKYKRNNQIWLLIKVDEQQNATYYTLRDPKGNELTYGTKVFRSLFKEIKE